MDRFVDTAYGILEVAENIAAAGQPGTDWTFVVSGTGAVRMMADVDTPLDSLVGEYGGAVFRVRSEGELVRLEGREAHRVCRLETPKPQAGRRRCQVPKLALVTAGRPVLPLNGCSRTPQ